MAQLTPQIEQHLSVNMNISKRSLMLSNFLGGLAWGLGSVVGATIVVALLIGFLKTINFVPIVGNFASQVIQVVDQKQLQK